MKKIILAAAVLSAFTTASFASQRSFDPDTTLNGRALSYVPAESSVDTGSSSALAIDNGFSTGRSSSSAFDRLEMNSYAATHGNKAN